MRSISDRCRHRLFVAAVATLVIPNTGGSTVATRPVDSLGEGADRGAVPRVAGVGGGDRVAAGWQRPGGSALVVHAAR
jgi:hypothetical protein